MERCSIMSFPGSKSSASATEVTVTTVTPGAVHRHTREIRVESKNTTYV